MTESWIIADNANTNLLLLNVCRKCNLHTFFFYVYGFFCYEQDLVELEKGNVRNIFPGVF